MKIAALICEGDKVVVGWTFQGTLAQDLQAQSTGQPFAVVSVAICRIVNGEIEEDWGVAPPLAQTDTPWE